MRDALSVGFAEASIAEEISRRLDEPEWLREDRLEALRLSRELPAETNRLFTSYLDLRAAGLSDVEPYLETGDEGTLETAMPAGAAAFVHVRDDTVVGRGLSEAARESGVIVDTFRNVLRTRPELLLRALVADAPTLPANDKFAQLARALCAVGVFVHVPAGVSLAGPVVVRWSVGGRGRALITRTVVRLEDGAHASLLEEQVGTGESNGAHSLWLGTMEVKLGKGATLAVAGEQDFDAGTAAFVNRHATLGQESALRWALATIGGSFHRSRIDNVLVGRGSSVQQVEIAFGGGTQLFDLTSYTRHVGEDTTGDLLSKGVFLDRARGFFKGLIEIQRTARGTDSFLGEFAMLLTKRARSVAIPSLEIDQPDVRRASHSSSVGPIDESQIFYLMSRGLDRDTARKFIVLGFLEPVVARIPLPEAQDRLRALLDRKWPAPEALSSAA